MITFKLDGDYDVIPAINGDGLITLETLSYPFSISQVVPLVIFTGKKGREYESDLAIDYSIYFGQNMNKINESILNLFATQLSALIGSIDSITDVNLSSATVDVINGSLDLQRVCWTIDCNEYTL
ncbi:hypothetical protein N9043_00740 [bacterium]|nr:hypothetical protein [bacterium]